MFNEENGLIVEVDVDSLTFWIVNLQQNRCQRNAAKKR